jgi:hypothetical protein
MSNYLKFTNLLDRSSIKSDPELEIKVGYNEDNVIIGKAVNTNINSYDKINKKVNILNGRNINTSLDKEGMVLLNQISDTTIDYYNNDDVINIYYNQLETFIKNEYNASKVIAFTHQVRSYKKEYNSNAKQTISKDPVLFAHTDYSIEGGINKLKSLGDLPLKNDYWKTPLLSQNEIKKISTKGNYMILHAWRNISNNILKRNPLALCCSNTTNDDDFISYDLCYEDHKLNVMMLKYNENQQWLYYPDQSCDELLLFKQYDSNSTFSKLHPEITNRYEINNDNNNNCNNQINNKDNNFISCFVAHSSFNDIKDKEEIEYLGRESIETGLILFFD